MKKIILLLILYIFSSFSLANELETRESIRQEVEEYFFKGDYLQLEDLANKYREEESRTSSGLWMLTSFYSAISKLQDSSYPAPKSWDDLIKRADLWIEKYPDSPTPYIAKSIILDREGWSIRGGGYARSVKLEAWEPFYEKIQEARTVLSNSKEVSNKDPHWYVLMADIATEQSWNDQEFKVLVNEGIEKNPYYFQLYFAIMRYYTPKWHGDAEIIEAFAREAVEKTRAKEGLGLYARIYWAASQSQFKGRLFELSSVNWEDMSKGIDDVLKVYPDQWNINNFALFSCLAQDKEKTRKLIAMIEGEPIKSGWLGSVKYHEYCKNWSRE